MLVLYAKIRGLTPAQAHPGHQIRPKHTVFYGWTSCRARIPLLNQKKSMSRREPSLVRAMYNYKPDAVHL